jgi:ATP-dependent helicase/nuclease subunit A
VHAFLEKIAQQLAAGQLVRELLASIPSWGPRITAVLRAEGLPPAQVDRLAQRVLVALKTTLNDPEGAWLLGAHAGAANEFALTAWAEQADRSSIRLDRRFQAGPEPLAPGDSFLWIVDYKTTPLGGHTLDEFVRVEREKYAPQLEAYARILGGIAADQSTTANTSPRDLRLALYYPMVPKLIWWSPART